MFITFEGIEGSGKSTQARLIKEYLEKKGRMVSLTREPGWGAVGSLIRHLIVEPDDGLTRSPGELKQFNGIASLNKEDVLVNPYTELYLFCADRVQHVQNFIKPKLDNKEDIICDRYFDSTIAYQGYGRKLDLDTIRKLASDSTLDVKPDVTFLMDLPVKEGLRRLQVREGETNRLDDESAEFHESIRQGYISEARSDTERIKVLDASLDREILHKQIRDVIDKVVQTSAVENPSF